MNRLQIKFDWKSKLRNRTSKKAKTVSSAAAKSRRKMKEIDPSKYEEYLKKDALRKRCDYAASSVKVLSSEHADIEIKKRRKRWADVKRLQRKGNQLREQAELRHGKPYKDMSETEKRQYMAKKKRESRQRMSIQKHSSIRKKETEKRRVSRNKGSENMVLENNPIDSSSSSRCSKSTIYRSTMRVKRTLPKSPRTFATVISNIVSKASPRKKTEMEKKGISRKLEEQFIIESLRENVGKIKTKMTEAKRRQYHLIACACQRVSRYGFQSKIAISLGISKKILQTCVTSEKTRRKRKDALSLRATEQVKQFWTSEGISRVLPLKKRVKKGQPLHVLQCSYKQAFQSFKKSFPLISIGYCKFVELKPKFVRHLKASERMVCCCIKCENINLKLKVLNSRIGDSSLRINTVNDLSDKTLCPYKDKNFPEKACIDRTCNQCGTSSIKEWLSVILESDGHREVQCDQWKYFEVERLIRKKGSQDVVKNRSKVLRLVTSAYSLKELVDLLINEMKLFSAHLFRAAWQQDQFQQARNNMPARSAVLVADFAMNYACSMQNEVQSYHWAQTQVTIHPVMVYINGSDKMSSEPTHTEAVFCITDDPKHDASAVENFMGCTYKFLKKKYKISSVHLFSDCCASQYRCMTSFADMCFIKNDHGLELTRHYFESSHGKSAADGLGAIVKHNATLAVTRGQVKIRNGQEFHEFCNKNLKKVGDGVFPSRVEAYKDASRTFFYIPSSDIKRDRPNRKVHPVKETMKIHSVHPTGVPYKMEKRTLSCFCTHCRYDQGSVCANIEAVGKWVKISLKPLNGVQKSSTDNSSTGTKGNCASKLSKQQAKTHFCVPKRQIITRRLAASIQTIQSSSTPLVASNTGVLKDSNDSIDRRSISAVDNSLETHDNETQDFAQNLRAFEIFMKKKLMSINGHTPSDGNCFFWALSDQLDQSDIQQFTHTELRSKLISHLEIMPQNEKDELQQFLVEPLKSYIALMAKDGTYADHIVVENMAKIFGLTIRVIQEDHEYTIGSGPVTVFLGYLRTKKHYVSLRQNVKMGDFVAVKLPTMSRKTSATMVYMAEVLQIDGQDISLRYMRAASPTGMLYIWPTKDDVSWQTIRDIICRVDSPTLINQRAQFSFKKTDIEKIRNMYKSAKFN